MRYKGEYAPSYLLDPVCDVSFGMRGTTETQGTNQFHLLDQRLDDFLQAHPRGYHPFADNHTEISNGMIVDATSLIGGEPGHRNGDDSDDEGEDEERMDEWPTPCPPGFSDPQQLSRRSIEDLLVLLKGKRGGSSLVRIGVSCHPSQRVLAREGAELQDLQFRNASVMDRLIRELAAAVGLESLATKPQDMEERGILHFG